MEAIAAFGQRLISEVGRVIVGKSDVVEFLAVAMLCEGHVLIEDVPGLGKTTLAKTLARCLDCRFSRIQFTPDLLPSDVTGIFFFNQKSGEFEFRGGPIHANVVLADEINRATPRTQSSLLEAMEERQVTVEGHTTPLPRPFLVLATQNPVELEGTFPLPEAQLDRFLLQVSLGYPTEAEELAILRRFSGITDGGQWPATRGQEGDGKPQSKPDVQLPSPDPLADVRPIATGQDMMELAARARRVHVDDSVAAYVLALTRGTREHEAVELGASPRASLALFHAAQALAALRGRTFVTPDDVKRLAAPTLGHRLILRQQGRLRGAGVERVLRSIVDATPVPAEPVPTAAARVETVRDVDSRQPGAREGDPTYQGF